MLKLKAAKPRFYHYGLELCPKTGKEHHQGFVHFDNPRSFSGVQKALKGFHIEIQRGSNESNFKYTGKGTDVVCWGKPHEQGHRSDLEGILAMVKEKKEPTEILEEFPGSYIRYHKHFNLPNPGLLLSLQDDFRHVTVTVLIGKSGAGKTRHVYDTHGHYQVAKITQYNPEWWQGHNNAPKVLLLDEYEAGAMNEDRLRQVTDGHPLDLPVKGGFIVASQVTHVYIISNSLLEWSVPMQRRISKTIVF